MVFLMYKLFFFKSKFQKFLKSDEYRGNKKAAIGKIEATYMCYFFFIKHFLFSRQFMILLVKK